MQNIPGVSNTIGHVPVQIYSYTPMKYYITGLKYVHHKYIHSKFNPIHFQIERT
jgi:hypothetical protein